MPENNKKSFIMYSNYRKFLSRLPDKDIADLIKAIFCFVEGEEVPELSQSAELCFIIISDQIKRDMEKYEKVCERRAIAGRLGGKQKYENRLKREAIKEREKDIKTEEKESLASVSKSSKCQQMLANVSKSKQTLANLADIDIDIDNDIDIDIDNENDIAKAIYINQKKTKQKKSESCYSNDFESFWQVYPRKSDKGSAYKKYLTRLKDGWSPEQLLTAAKKYRAQIVANRTDQKYIKLCKTFLSDTTPFADYLTKTERQGVSNDAENPYAEWKEGANG
nr:MAG TPA: putative replisome organizer protein [Caudoviricetes sp.]